MTIKDSICDWTLTAEQMEVSEHQFCFQVRFFKYQAYNKKAPNHQKIRFYDSRKST